jgi:GH15 family glucan-1,4-alpha-glucosidase
VSHKPISEYALLSDCNSAALIDRDGSVDWWCAPRFDSDSVFARLLDERAGHFTVRAREVTTVDRRYEDDSLVLKTTAQTETGVVEERVALLMSEGTRGHDLGKDVPHVLARHLRCTEGSVELEVEFVPRFEYGLTVPLIHKEEGGPLWARGGPMTLVLSTNAGDATIERGVAAMTVGLDAGEEVAFSVQAISSWESIDEPWSETEIEGHLDDTVEAWRDWGSHHQNYDGPYLELVEHSGRVLQGLTYQPTGAMVAAATTSLPEEIGGQRNWDYRYCWIRDAGFTLRALWVAACPDEAEFYLDYITAAAGSASEPGDLQIMHGIRGERDLTERPIPWLSGWQDSAPVRIGNGAWDQTQHDIYGELLLSVHHLREQFGELTDIERRLLIYLADAACETWKEPDHGIWEIRDERRHYVHSKLMCWVALERAIDMATDLGASDEAVRHWKKSRGEIAEAILDRGWSDSIGAFTQAFDVNALDAASLVIPMVGFLSFNDDRVRGTVDAIRRELVDDNGLVHRYRTPDGLPGEEGAFLLCTFWLAEALAGLGEVEEARRVFEKASSFANDLGLFSEEVDAPTGQMLGNYPQAFSHVGLINAAWAITEAERGSESEPGIVI